MADGWWLALNRPNPLRFAERPAFTLIELLIVVAILAALVAILLPALSGALNATRTTTCQVKLRELARATQVYALDHQDRLPRSTHSALAANAAPWEYELLPTLGVTDRITTDAALAPWREALYRCPADRRTDPTYSYGLNVYFELSAAETGGPTWRTLGRLPRPGGTVLFAELSAGPHVDHIMAHFWSDADEPTEVAATRHQGQSNYVFCDGRVERLAFEQTYAPAEQVNGWNPATAP